MNDLNIRKSQKGLRVQYSVRTVGMASSGDGLLILFLRVKWASDKYSQQNVYGNNAMNYG